MEGTWVGGYERRYWHVKIKATRLDYLYTMNSQGRRQRSVLRANDTNALDVYVSKDNN
jgi:hypothetical protein